NELVRINAAESVHTIVLLIDSPGGTVDGMESFAEAIKNSPKTTVSVIDGMMASAAYRIGSSADKIIATAKTDIIGSIGTMISFYDRTQYNEDQGIILREYFADASKDKNRDFREAKAGKGRLLIESLLNPMNDIFLEAVKENRGDKLNEKETLTGKTFLAEQAKEYGLIDEISSLDTTIENLLNKNTSIKMKIKSTFKNIMSLLGITASTEEVELSQEQLTKIDAALPELEQAKAKVTELEASAKTDKETIAAVTKERDEANAKVAKLEEDLKKEKAEVERLGKMDAGKFSNAESKGDKRADADEVDPMQMDFQKELLEKV
ncbi:MAG TPA: S49 family peptidase, partial [Flavisolibacter sp.]|nr:S49 family peptidase [Flavisolibacter sp.]